MTHFEEEGLFSNTVALPPHLRTLVVYPYCRYCQSHDDDGTWWSWWRKMGEWLFEIHETIKGSSRVVNPFCSRHAPIQFQSRCHWTANCQPMTTASSLQYTRHQFLLQ